jgi:hypothetical protein
VNKALLKSPAFYADLVLTLASLLLASGLVTSDHTLHVVGWVVSILTTLGFHSLLPSAPKADAPAATEPAKQ